MGNCKAPTEVYSRVVLSNYRPVQHWNPGKQAEFHDRVPFAVQGGTMETNTDNPARPIHCANCLHCKEFTYTSLLTGVRERRLRCAAGQWATPSGREKTYALHTALIRRKDQCAHYDSMGEDNLPDFLKTLRETLPAERIFENPPRAERHSA